VFATTKKKKKRGCDKQSGPIFAIAFGM